MQVEINNPLNCTIVNQEGDAAKLPPPKGKSRVCRQCGQDTWLHTSACMWCGHDRWSRIERLTRASGGALLAAAVIFPWLAR